jgi:hypothetical protein
MPRPCADLYLKVVCFIPDYCGVDQLLLLHLLYYCCICWIDRHLNGEGDRGAGSVMLKQRRAKVSIRPTTFSQIMCTLYTTLTKSLYLLNFYCKFCIVNFRVQQCTVIITLSSRDWRVSTSNCRRTWSILNCCSMLAYCRKKVRLRDCRSLPNPVIWCECVLL